MVHLTGYALEPLLPQSRHSFHGPYILQCNAPGTDFTCSPQRCAGELWINPLHFKHHIVYAYGSSFFATNWWWCIPPDMQRILHHFCLSHQYHLLQQNHDHKLAEYNIKDTSLDGLTQKRAR